MVPAPGTHVIAFLKMIKIEFKAYLVSGSSPSPAVPPLLILILRERNAAEWWPCGVVSWAWMFHCMLATPQSISRGQDHSDFDASGQN